MYFEIEKTNYHNVVIYKSVPEMNVENKVYAIRINTCYLLPQGRYLLKNVIIQQLLV